MHQLARPPAISLYSRVRPGFERRVFEAERVLRDAAVGHSGKVVFTTSLGAEDMVITDLIARHQLTIELLTLDTGKLHPQTLDMISRIRERYDLQVGSVRPLMVDVVHFVSAYGELGMRTSVDLRKSCCAIRKVEPLQHALKDKTAWVTGIRRKQSSERADVPLISIDGVSGRTKYSPLADWGWGDVWRYIERNDVPYNALHDAFFPSIGCEPCTRAVSLGEDLRSGRWWWEDQNVKECGLHRRPEGPKAAPAVPPEPRATEAIP